MVRAPNLGSPNRKLVPVRRALGKPGQVNHSRSRIDASLLHDHRPANDFHIGMKQKVAPSASAVYSPVDLHSIVVGGVSTRRLISTLRGRRQEVARHDGTNVPKDFKRLQMRRLVGSASLARVPIIPPRVLRVQIFQMNCVSNAIVEIGAPPVGAIISHIGHLVPQPPVGSIQRQIVPHKWWRARRRRRRRRGRW